MKSTNKIIAAAVALILAVLAYFGYGPSGSSEEGATPDSQPAAVVDQ